jgi:1,2-phenylacetyl-CoA epoxidase PaaB subunit
MTRSQSSLPAWALSGRDLRTLMRQYHVTIRALAQRMAIPMTRVRYRRQQGIAEWHVIRDWMEAMTGVDPGPIPHPVHHGTAAETVAP